MKLLKQTGILILLTFLAACHSKQNPVVQILPNSSEFRKIAWISGLWTNPDDSIQIFMLWNRSNDTLFSGSNWEMEGKDSIPTEIHEIRSSEDGILLSVEIFGKNDGNPSEYKLISNKNGEQVFESPGNDYPQRIIYLLKADGSLYLRMEGISDEQSRFEEKKLTKIR